MSKLLSAWATLAFVFFSAVAASESRLEITLVPPDLATRVVLGEAWKVFLRGRIDPDASRRLAFELARNHVQRGFAFLNSSGGSVNAGMEIGRLLRKHGLTTYVRRQAGARDVPGECFSACVFAFVGGYFRYLKEEDAIGVHRFSTTKPTDRDLDFAQIVSGSITAYLSEMGVDIRFFELMTRVPSDKIYRLSLREASNLRVANNGFQPPVWSIEAVSEGLYLRGAQEGFYGLGKVTFVCGDKDVIFYPFYEGGSNSDIIVSTTERHSLRLDDEFIDIGVPVIPLTANKGFVSAAFVLPSSLVERIKSAKSVGYAAHPGNPHIFAGFTVEIGAERQKIANYFTQCLSAYRK